MDDYEKYLKYKAKYLALKKQMDLSVKSDIETNTDESIVLEGGGKKKFICTPNKRNYKEICIENHNGSYETKEICEENCDPKFITVQLKKANLYKESLQFYYFINDLIKKENMSIYIKGGNVIGLAVLKLIWNKYHNDDNKFKRAFLNFLKLELIKDWDFTAYTDGIEINEKYRDKLDKIASKQKLVPRAKTFVLYQTKYPILIYEKALFEIAVLDSDSMDFSKMEIPLTTMKVKINQQNIKYIFMLAKSFYSWTEKHIPIDLDILKKILSTIEIIIHPHKSGYYNPEKALDAGEINKNLIRFINNFTNGNKYETQFLITQLEDPYRLIFRMPEKNIKKTEQIIHFIQRNIYGLKKPDWLVNPVKTSKLVEDFINNLSKELLKIYKKTKSFDSVLEFLQGVNFGKPQIQIEWDEFNQNTKSRLQRIFKPVISEIGLNNFIKLIDEYNINPKLKPSELTNSEKIINLFEFLLKKKFFK